MLSDMRSGYQSDARASQWLIGWLLIMYCAPNVSRLVYMDSISSLMSARKRSYQFYKVGRSCKKVTPSIEPSLTHLFPPLRATNVKRRQSRPRQFNLRMATRLSRLSETEVTFY